MCSVNNFTLTKTLGGKKMKKVICLILVVIMFSVLLTSCGKNESTPAENSNEQVENLAEEQKKLLDEPMTFKVSFAEDGNNILVKECEKAFKEITEATNGELLFEIFPSNALGSITDVGEQMSLGAPIIHSFGMDGLGEYCDAINPLSCMYTFESYEEYFALITTDWWDNLMQQLREDANFYVVGTGITGWRSFISSKPIRSGEDLKGMNVRMGPAAMTQGFIKLLGGSPFTAPWADNYTNIQTGIYDACEGPLSLIYSSSLYEVAPYLTISEHTLNAPLLTINCDYWDKIPTEYQEVMKEKLADAFQRLYEQQIKDDAQWVEKFEEVCNEVIIPDKSTFTWVTSELLEYLGYDPSFYNEVREVIKSAM